MARSSILIFFVLVFIPRWYCAQEEYYWQKYNGTVPEDALVGGYDSNGDDIYIGQANVESEGLIVVAIYQDIPYVQVPVESRVQRVDSGISILCGSEQPVDWIRAKSDNLQVVLIGQKAVIGGKIERQGHLHIGRISYENEIKIGPISSFFINAARLEFVHKDGVLSSDNYEVLVYGAQRPRERRRRPFRRGPGRRSD